MALCLQTKTGPEEHINQCKCKSCIQFDSGNNPDFSIIAPEGNSIKIEQIRLMQTKIVEKPIVSNKKVYLIDDSQTMTTEAQNCLLKTLEEPPEYVMIILICNNENQLLPTIKSRCTKVVFQKIENEVLRKYIEDKGIINHITNQLLQACSGSIGKAYLLKNEQESLEQVNKVIENMEQKDKIDFTKEAQVFYTKKENAASILDLLEYANDILFEKAKKDARYQNCITFVEEAKRRIKQNGNLDMTMDNMLWNIWEEIHEKYNRS